MGKIFISLLVEVETEPLADCISSRQPNQRYGCGRTGLQAFRGREMGPGIYLDGTPDNGVGRTHLQPVGTHAESL